MSKLEDLKTKLTRKQRILILILAAVLLLGLLSATVLRSEVIHLARRATYSQNDEPFSHNAQTSSLFLGMDNNLLICTQSQLQLISPGGTARLKESISMTSPALNTAGKFAVVYDVGGQQLCLVAGEKLLYNNTFPDETIILSATVNDSGWMAVTTREDGYKAVVTVYNDVFEPVMSIRLSSRYISDSVVTPDCHGVYLISPGQEAGAFENTLLYYSLTAKDDPILQISLGSNAILSVKSDGKCWLLGDKALFVLDSRGSIKTTYDYNGQYLKAGTLNGDDFALLLLSLSSSGNSGTLVSVDEEGEELGTLDISGQILAVAARSHNVAALTTSAILNTDRKMETYVSTPNQHGIRSIVLYADGGGALIGSSTAQLYYPTGQRISNSHEEETTE